MNKLTFILFLMPLSLFANDTEHLRLIDGQWQCYQEFVEEGMTTKIDSRYSYRSADLTYTTDYVAKYIYQEDMPVGSISVTDQGTFTYSASKMRYKSKHISLEVLTDPVGVLQNSEEGLLKEMKQEIAQDNTEYLTTFINHLVWETQDPTDGTTTHCVRINEPKSKGTSFP